MTDNPAYDLYKSHRFREAIEAYKRQLQEAPDDKWPNMHGLGSSLMAAGEYAEAIPYLEKVDEYEHQLPGRPGRGEQLAICYWMIGERLQALGLIKGLVVGVRDGKIHYTDFAGGTSQGVILCYMAATLGMSADVDIAVKYLKKLATHRRIHNWPGPAALFLLGRLSFEDALKDGTGFADLPEAEKVAEEDVLKRRRLTNLLFAAGTQRRMAGDEPGCRMYMVECANLGNTLAEYEWHLARGEVSAQS